MKQTIRKANLFEHESLSGSAENSIMCKQLWYWSKNAGADLQAGRLLAFHEAVEFFAVQNCSQVRDSVFGLLGISDSCIRPEYTMSITELYARTLYNCLVSLWVKRPRELPDPNQKLSYFETLQSLGSDYSKLRSIGETLIHAFKLDRFQGIVFLVSYEVCKRFLPGLQLLAHHALASSWLMDTSYLKLEFEAADKGLMKQKWYDSENQALRRIDRELLRRLNEGLTYLEAAEKVDRDLKAPGDDGQKMRYS